MSENRQDLNKIIGSLTTLDVKLGNMKQAIEKEVLCFRFDNLYNYIYI